MCARTALLVLLGFTLLHTWPLSGSPASLSLNHNADAELNAWTLSWLARAFVRDPGHLFDGNIFWPEPSTLVFTEPMIVPALIGTPVRLLGGSPVLTYNIVLLVGLTLTAWAAWLVACRWTGSPGAALVAGVLVAFNVHLLTRLPHIVAAHMWGVPLAFWLGDRLLAAPSRRAVLLLGLGVAATAVTSAYTLALVGVVLAAVLMVAAAQRHWRAAGAVVAALGAGLVAAGPVLWPYLRFGTEGASRPIEMVADFSASPAGYLTSMSRLHDGWSSAFFRDDVNVFFAGFAALVLAGIGVWHVWRHPEGRRRTWLLGLAATIGIWLSFGPATTVFQILYEWFLPMRGLRAAARFGYLWLVVVGLAAAWGVAALEWRLPAGRGRAWLVAGVLVLVTAETWMGPVRTVPFAGVPAIYDQLAAIDPVRLVEVPFYPPDTFFLNGEYVLNSTAHWKPLVNGYSGFVPMSYREHAAAFWYFPQERAIGQMHRESITHVMVHLEKFTPTEIAEIEDAIRRRDDLRLLAADTQGHRLYAVLGAGF